MSDLKLFLVAVTVAASTACKKHEGGDKQGPGATSAEFAAVLDASNPDKLRAAIDAITKAHPDHNRPARYESGNAFVDLDNRWIGQVTCGVDEQTGQARGPCMFFFKGGCCDDALGTDKLVDAVAKLDPDLQPVQKKVVDAVANKVEYELGGRASFSTGGGFAATLAVCTMQHGSACIRIAKAIASGKLPEPSEILPNNEKK